MAMRFIEDLRAKLNSITLISDDEFDQSIRLFKPVRIYSGEYFVKVGQVCDQIAFIGKGILRTFNVNENGDESTICFCSENRFTTAFRSFITTTQSTLAIQAVEDCELLALKKNDLEHLYASTEAWPKIGRLLAEKEYLNMESYALTLNRETAKEKYDRLLREQPSVVQRVPVQQIASYLGVTRETLSRIRNQVANDYVTFIK
jgi:CRP-like cAMP-binding protein